MRKKYLSALLFGALLFASTGTFTSCKDYDDDIANLQEQVDGIKASVEELTTKFGSLACVKSVSFEGGILTVVDSNNQTSTYQIPDNNTTYTLKISQDGAKATLALVGSDGQTSEVSLDAIDPSLFSIEKQADGSLKVVYGSGDKKQETDIVIPALSIVEIETENGVLIGWSIDGTTLKISDVLPITGFEYIPETVLTDFGERVIVFNKDNYTPVSIVNDAVVRLNKTNYLPNQATPDYWVNPSSATVEQLAGEGKAKVLHSVVEGVSRASQEMISWKKTSIENGKMTVTLEADPNQFVTDEKKLDEIALQFTTNAGNTITTEYVGVINKSEKLDLVLADKELTEKNPQDENCHFATSKVDAASQSAQIGADNKPLANNAHLVQTITYSKAIEGINLLDYVTVCNTAEGHKFFEYDKFDNLKIIFEEVEYDAENTPQHEYMQLSGTDNSTFKAVNYGQINKSCIGKTPIVLAKLIDTANNNEIVAAAYIKFLIAGDEAAVAYDNIVIEQNENICIGCNTPNHIWSATDKFMSTEVYTFTHQGNEGELEALSKEQFHLLYDIAPSTSLTDGQMVEGNKVVGNWTVTSATDPENEINRLIEFTLTEPSGALEAKNYVAYAVYTKSTDANDLQYIANNNMYPEKVVVKYVLTVKDINFTASIEDGNKIAEYWDGNSINVYAKTPGNVEPTITQDLLTNFEGRKVVFKYSGDITGYDSFTTDKMDYKFRFAASNIDRIVKDADENAYELFLNADHTKLYAVAQGAVHAINDNNLVASLEDKDLTVGDIKNNNVVFAETEVAKKLLNVAPRGSENTFYASIEVVYFNGCDMEVPVTNGEFEAYFIRPVTVEADSKSYFEDGNNAGECKLELTDLVNFYDWRLNSPLNSFAENLNYYSYYNVQSIKLDTDKAILTNLNRGEEEFVDIKEIFGNQAASTLLTFDTKDVNYSGTTVTVRPDFGSVTYKNKDVTVNKEFKLRIPLVINYYWGSIKATITVPVKPTL